MLMLLNFERCRYRCTDVYGAIMTSSWSWPQLFAPFEPRTPITLNVMFFRRITFPTGSSSSPKRLDLTVVPMQHTRAASRVSSSVKKRPSVTVQLLMFRTSVATPCTFPDQFFAPYIICTVVLTCGLTPCTRCPSSRLIASASPAVIVWPWPIPPETGPWLRLSGNTIIRLLPIEEISFTIIVFAPSPMAMARITATIPMPMPRHDRNDRMGFRPSDFSDTLKIVVKLIRLLQRLVWCGVFIVLETRIRRPSARFPWRDASSRRGDCR